MSLLQSQFIDGTGGQGSWRCPLRHFGTPHISPWSIFRQKQYASCCQQGPRTPTDGLLPAGLVALARADSHIRSRLTAVNQVQLGAARLIWVVSFATEIGSASNYLVSNSCCSRWCLSLGAFSTAEVADFCAAFSLFCFAVFVLAQFLIIQNTI